MAKFNVLDKDGTVILKLDADDLEAAQKMAAEFQIEGVAKIEEQADQ